MLLRPSQPAHHSILQSPTSPHTQTLEFLEKYREIVMCVNHQSVYMIDDVCSASTTPASFFFVVVRKKTKRCSFFFYFSLLFGSSKTAAPHHIHAKLRGHQMLHLQTVVVVVLLESYHSVNRNQTHIHTTQSYIVQSRWGK
jgi:undecaprenyl pyrophosphate phosphatase UppP